MGPCHLSDGRVQCIDTLKNGSLVPETSRTELTPNQTGRTSAGLNGTELPYLNLKQPLVRPSSHIDPLALAHFLSPQSGVWYL